MSKLTARYREKLTEFDRLQASLCRDLVECSDGNRGIQGEVRTWSRLMKDNHANEQSRSCIDRYPFR
jgi:hypothetical protein